MQPIEITAAVFGFLCVAFYITRSVWSWPTGLVQVVLYIAVFWHAKLYADMVLHVIYVFLQLYGWWAWVDSKRRGKMAGTEDVHHAGQIVVRRLTFSTAAVALAITSGLWVLFVWGLKNWTDAQSPEADSFVAAASLVAQFLLARRYVENWVYWIVIDVVGIGLFWSRGLPTTAILYSLFLIMAVVGLITWMRALDKERRGGYA